MISIEVHFARAGKEWPEWSTHDQTSESMAKNILGIAEIPQGTTDLKLYLKTKESKYSLFSIVFGNMLDDSNGSYSFTKDPSVPAVAPCPPIPQNARVELKGSLKPKMAHITIENKVRSTQLMFCCISVIDGDSQEIFSNGQLIVRLQEPVVLASDTGMTSLCVDFDPTGSKYGRRRWSIHPNRVAVNHGTTSKIQFSLNAPDNYQIFSLNLSKHFSPIQGSLGIIKSDFGTGIIVITKSYFKSRAPRVSLPIPVKPSVFTGVDVKIMKFENNLIELWITNHLQTADRTISCFVSVARVESGTAKEIFTSGDPQIDLKGPD
ncbi:MAG: hypothetical protein AAGD38_03125 [Acidobacteriota bacterium]